MTTYTPTRPVMTRDELQAHHVADYGRDYSRSDDGYDDIEANAGDGWKALSCWGADGWDLGEWPYVVLSTKILDGSDSLQYATTADYGLLSVVEGDHTRYHFRTRDDLHAALDYLFLWYAFGNPDRHHAWVGEQGDDARGKLDRGELEPPEELRGPYRTR